MEIDEGQVEAAERWPEAVRGAGAANLKNYDAAARIILGTSRSFPEKDSLLHPLDTRSLRLADDRGYGQFVAPAGERLSRPVRGSSESLDELRTGLSGDEPRGSGRLYAAVAGHEEHKGAVDE